MPQHHAALRELFLAEIYPVLTPLAVDRTRSRTSSLTSVAVSLRDPETDERRLPGRGPAGPEPPDRAAARAEQPIGQHRYTLLDQVIGANLDILFNGMEVLNHLFRLTRDADLTDEEDASDLLVAIEEELRRRASASRFASGERSMPDEMRDVSNTGWAWAS